MLSRFTDLYHVRKKFTLQSSIFEMFLKKKFQGMHWFWHPTYQGITTSGTRMRQGISNLFWGDDFFHAFIKLNQLEWWLIVTDVSSTIFVHNIFQKSYQFIFQFFFNSTKIKVKSFECLKSKPATYCFIFNLSK